VPKERSHWLLAQRAVSLLPRGPLADAALAYGDFVLAGAVAHDSGYYAGAMGRRAGRLAADRLHGGRGWDTFVPFRVLASRRDLGAPALAFGFGALTHLAADAVFHPLVYAWTGDGDAPDDVWRHGWVFRHQALESALDRHFEALWQAAPAATVSALIRDTGRALPVIHSVFSGGDSTPWLAAHARLQQLFDVAPALWLVRLTTWTVRGSDADPTGAFYRSSPRPHASFEGRLEWTHPVTGVREAATLDELVQRFERLALELAVEWERLWLGGNGLQGAGPHLDTGLPSDLAQSKTWFSGRPWGLRPPR